MHSGKSIGGKISGNQAVKNKTGIHAFTEEQKRAISKKGKINFLWKYQNISEFRELHRMKIRYGKLCKRFDRLRYEQLDSQTLFIHTA
jgi:hypothetical protein